MKAPSLADSPESAFAAAHDLTLRFPLECLTAATVAETIEALDAWSRRAFGVSVLLEDRSQRERAAAGAIENVSPLGVSSAAELVELDGLDFGLRLEGECAPAAAAAIAPYRSLIAAALARGRELERAKHRVSELERAKRLQEALYEIADLASGGSDMDDVFARLHEVVGRLMYAENFYIALYDRSSRSIRFPISATRSIRSRFLPTGSSP